MSNDISNSRTRLIPKREFQVLLKHLRANGYKVEKSARTGAYVVYDDSAVILKALNGNHAYMARMSADYFAV